MSESMDASDVPGRIDSDDRVSPDARRAARSMDANAGTVENVEPCDVVPGAAEVTVRTPMCGITRALRNTGYELRGVLTCHDDHAATVWIAPE